MVGLALGVLIGMVSGLAVLLMLRTSSRVAIDLRSLVALVGELLSIPTFWFGGPWITATMLQGVRIDDILSPYMASLAVTFGLISAWPLIKMIVQVGNEVGRWTGEARG